MDDLLLRERFEAGASVLEVRGELDLWTGPALDDRLIEPAALGRGRIVLDAAGLTLCDAAGIRILLRGNARARARAGWLRLVGADQRLCSRTDRGKRCRTTPGRRVRPEAAG